MTVESLRKLNSNIQIHTTDSPEFAKYGEVINSIDATEIIKTAETIKMPDSGSAYEASTPAFESLAVAGEIKSLLFGGLDTQVGYCYGHSSYLNALEWHKNSEINIAVTDLVLLLATRFDLKDGKLDSSDVEAFYIRRGEVIEVYATTLHFCPLEVESAGFGCVVALPVGTNTPLDEKTSDPYLFKKNKWLIAHNGNQSLIDKGIIAGIGGENIKINYR